MSADTRSALTRAARTAIQVVAAWVVTAFVVRVPSLEPHRQSLMLVCTVGLATLFAWVWRRWIDRTSVPSLVDPDTREASEWRDAA